MTRILKKLAPHTEESIHRKANYLGLRRRRTPKPKYRVLEQLRAARETSGLTRAQLAASMGYHVLILGRWERGEQFPSMRRLHDWADALEMVVSAEPHDGYVHRSLAIRGAKGGVMNRLTPSATDREGPDE